MKSINKSAPVKAEKSIIINADIQKVWKTLTDINNWSDWNHDIPLSKLNGEIKIGQTFDWHTGRSKIHSEIHTYNPNIEFGWTGKVLGISAIHNWKLSEIENTTKVIVEESMEGFLTQLFRKSIQKNLDNGMEKWLELLKNECEN